MGSSKSENRSSKASSGKKKSRRSSSRGTEEEDVEMLDVELTSKRPASAKKSKKDKKKKDSKKRRRSSSVDDSERKRAKSVSFNEESNTTKTFDRVDSDSSAAEEQHSVPSTVVKGVVFKTAQATSQPSPLLATFPQGSRPSDDVAFGLFSKSGKSKSKLVYARTRAMELQGKNHGGMDRSSRKLCRHLLFRYDPKTKEAVLMNPDIETQYPIEMRNTIRHLPEPNVDLSENKLDEDEVENKEKITADYLKRRRSLIDTFGSTKTKRQTISQEENRIDSSIVAVSDSIQESLVNGAGKQSSSLSDVGGEMASRRDLLPNFNIDAQFPSEVYTLDDLCPLEERKSLKLKVSSILKEGKSPVWLGRMEDENAFSKYVLSHLARLSNSTIAKQEAKDLVRGVVYIQYLFQMYRMPRFISLSDVQQKLGEDAPKLICSNLFKMYTDRVEGSGKRTITKRMRDKILLKMLALCLRIDGFKINSDKLDLIRQDMNQTESWVTNYFRELGCKVTAARGASGKKDGKQVALVVPLKFPRKMKARK
mmetsp:Transcript_9599/g.20893  ORF Transcript_9599/g.20893 Transcript_9599/m.20893 type:complete len:537 (-) Transcript_9599:1453-3063(-)